MHFSERVAVVTGAASGIGAALSLALAERGAHVVLADTDSVALARQADRFARRGYSIHAVPTDVSRQDEVEHLIDRALIRHSQLDFMFNNAGIGGTLPFADACRSQWEQVLATNLWGVIYGTERAYRVMVEQGHGHIVNTATIGGPVPDAAQTL